MFSVVFIHLCHVCVCVFACMLACMFACLCVWRRGHFAHGILAGLTRDIISMDSKTRDERLNDKKKNVQLRGKIS